MSVVPAAKAATKVGIRVAVDGNVLLAVVGGVGVQVSDVRRGGGGTTGCVSGVRSL